MHINQENTSGPVVSVIRVNGYDQMLALANDTPFGLALRMRTTSLKHATHFKRHEQAGMPIANLPMVNLPTAGVDYHVPFDGCKSYSCGPREQGRYAAGIFTNVEIFCTQP